MVWQQKREMGKLLATPKQHQGQQELLLSLALTQPLIHCGASDTSHHLQGTNSTAWG